VNGSVTVRTGLRPTRLEIDLDAIRDNVAHLRCRTGTEVCAVVKADGYGHGAVPVARAALEGGASWLAVALVEEGLTLRAAGIGGPILLLSEPPVAAVPELLAAELTPTVYREPFLAAVGAAGHQREHPVPVHLNVDTGMGRVGVPLGAVDERLRQLTAAPGITVEGIFTHLARADEPDVATTGEQLAAFDRCLGAAERIGVHPRLRHAANTAGALLHPRSRYDLIRPGIGIYGLSPAAEVDARAHQLRPALRLVSEVSFAKRITGGTPVSYGHRWYAPADGWVATVPIGYADGVPRALTNTAEVLLGGRRRRIAGTVTMDQLLVWCGDDEPRIGDEVVLLGEQGSEHVRVEEWAEIAGSITYEIVTQLSARVPRHHLG
jgi:alanine racemase